MLLRTAPNLWRDWLRLPTRRPGARRGPPPDTLAARVFEAECDAYPEAIRLFAEGRLVIETGQLRIG